MPDISDTVLGLTLLVIGVVVGTTLALLNSPSDVKPERTLTVWALATALPTILFAVPTALAGLGLVLGSLGGLWWLPLAVIAAFLGGLIQAWVLLIEILR